MTYFNSESDLLSYLEKYRAVHAPHTKDDVEQLNALVDTVELPAFYTFEDPKPEYSGVVSKTVEGFTVNVADENDISIDGNPFTSLTAAYDAVQGLGGNIVFSGDLAAAGVADRMFITEGRRMLLTVTDDRKRSFAKYEYLTFLFQTEAYYSKKDDFLTAYQWVQSHPAFWYRHDANSHNWEKSYGKFWFDVNRSDDGSLVYMLEAGGAVEPARVQHYHDLRLDVYAASFEDAYVQLAALVDKFFHLDGSDRENVDYVPSKLEVILKERLAEAHNEFGEGSLTL